MQPQYDGPGIHVEECSTAMVTFRLAIHAGATHGLDGWHAVCDAIGMPYLLEAIPDKNVGDGVDEFNVPDDAMQQALYTIHRIPYGEGKYLSNLFGQVLGECLKHNALGTLQPILRNMCLDIRDKSNSRAVGSYSSYVMTSIYYVARYLRSDLADDNFDMLTFAALTDIREDELIQLRKTRRGKIDDTKDWYLQQKDHARYDADLTIVRRILAGLERHYGYAAIRAEVYALAKLCKVGVDKLRRIHRPNYTGPHKPRPPRQPASKPYTVPTHVETHGFGKPTYYRKHIK